MVAVCVEMHASVARAGASFLEEQRRPTYTTPTSYLRLLHLFSAILERETAHLHERLSRYQTGVEKLRQTNKLVETMRKQLVALEPGLKQSAADTAKLAQQVATDQQAADAVKARVEKEEAAVASVAAEAEGIAQEAQRELHAAMPAFSAALRSLDALDKKDIVEVRGYKEPPALVQLVMDAIQVLMGDSTPTWAEAKRLLGDPQLIERLRSYDKDSIPERMLKVLHRYTKKDEFKPEVVAKVSQACCSLCMAAG